MAAGSIVVDLLMKTGSFETDTARAGKALKKFEKDAADVGKVVGLAFVGASAAIAGITRASINSLDAFNDLSDATGSSVENLSALERVAKLNGQTLDDVGGILVKFNAGLKEVDGKNGVSQALKAIGLDAKELQKIDPAEALRQTAVALSGFADDGNKARIVQELFGKSVREAAPFLKDLAEAGKLNATATTEQAKAAEAFNKEIFALQTNVSEAVRGIVGDFIPAINDLITGFGKLREQGVNGSFLDGLFGTSPQARLVGQAQDISREIERVTDSVARMQVEFNRSGDTQLGVRIEKARGRLRELQTQAQATTGQLKTLADLADPIAGAALDYGNEGRNRPRPKLAALTPPGKAGPKPRDDFTGLLKQATEMRALADAALRGEESLSAAQQLATKIAADYGKGLVNLTQAQFLQLDAELKGADASQRGAELRDRATRATQEAAQAFEQQYQSMLQVRDAFLEEALASNEALAAFGKTRLEVEELSIAKIRASAAALQHKAILREERDELDPIARLYREQAAALLDTAKARGALNEKERALTYDSLTGQTQAVKDYLAEINKAGRDTYDLVRGTLEGLEDTLTTAFTGGDAKSAFKSFIDSILAEATRLYVVKPLLNSIFGGAGSGGVDYAKLLSSFGSLFGGSAAPSSTGPAYVYPGSYATGMQSVPRDGYAFLHKDETVVPKAYSPGARSGGEMKVVVNAPPGTRVDRQNERQTPDGRELEVFLSMAEQRVASNVGRGRGPVSGALKTRGVSLSGGLPRRA